MELRQKLVTAVETPTPDYIYHEMFDMILEEHK